MAESSPDQGQNRPRGKRMAIASQLRQRDEDDGRDCGADERASDGLERGVVAQPDAGPAERSDKQSGQEQRGTEHDRSSSQLSAGLDAWRGWPPIQGRGLPCW